MYKQAVDDTPGYNDYFQSQSEDKEEEEDDDDDDEITIL